MNPPPQPTIARQDRLAGLLLGTAVGDALGLPAEGLSRRRLARLGWNGHWRHHFLGGRGMTSDDTEHTVIVAETLLRSSHDAAVFTRLLGWRLRWWLAAVPAGIGFGTLRACVKLWLGFPPAHSGVRSAGNGPAMRAALLGAHFAGQPRAIASFVHAATIPTHTDPRAHTGALAIALCAESAMLARAPDDTLARLAEAAPQDDAWHALVVLVRQALADGWTVARFCQAIGCANGVSGYSYHTVPVAVFAFLRAGDFRAALEEVLDSGGDTDTVGAITGALLGCRFGTAAIPAEWVAGIMEFPKGTAHLRKLAAALDGASPPTVRAHAGWLLPARQLLFTLTVLLHGFRRLLPPW